MAYVGKRGTSWGYVVDIGINPKTGKRKQKAKSGFKTKKAAQLAAAKVEKEIHEGTFVQESTITFREYIDQWFPRYSKLVQPGTSDSRRTSIKKLNEYFAHYPLKKIKKNMYMEMLHDLHDNGYSENSIKSIHSTARLIFKSALEDTIRLDPTDNMDFRFLKKKKVVEDKLNVDENFLEKEELAMFLQIAKRQKFPQDFAVYSVLAYTGLRRGELCVLKWDDIDFATKTLSITKTYYSESKRIDDFSLVPPKTRGSIRVIDVDDFVIDTLKEHKSWQNEFIMKNRKTYTDYNFAFINTSKYPGFPMHPHYIYDHMKKILKKMEHPKKLAPHSLRHTHASLCIEAEIELRDIAERLGHDDMKTLNKIYAHTTKGQKQKTSARFSNLMKEVREKISF